MKYAFTFLVTFRVYIQLSAQTNVGDDVRPCCKCPDEITIEIPDSVPSVTDTTVYVFADEMPVFPGGDSAWRVFVMKTMRHPNPEIEGTVYVRFIVEKDGAITNVEVLKHPDSQALALEARTIVMSSPNWVPGKQAGKTVRCSVIQPIRFTLQ